MEMQLALIKYGKFSYSDVDTMPLYELRWFYSRLVELAKENKEIEDDTN